MRPRRSRVRHLRGGGSVNRDEVDRIEAELACSLPADYRAFLIQNAAELKQAELLMPLYAVLWSDPDVIVEENRSAREYATSMTIGEEQAPWPETFIVVGTNGGGDYWFIDRDRDDSGIFLWRHELQDIEPYAADFRQYMLKLRSDVQACIQRLESRDGDMRR